METAVYFDYLILLFFGLLWTFIVTFLRVKKKKSAVYLIFFTIFYIYLFKVLDYTLFQFQSLILLKFFMPNLMLRGQMDTEAVNIIPLISLTTEGIKTSLLNILMMIPFGLLLPLVTNFRLKEVILTGALLSLCIETLQFLTGKIANITFRIVDINDLIFNTSGTALGYLLFILLVQIIRKIAEKNK